MSQEPENHGAANTNKSIPFIPKCLSPLIFIFLDSIKLIFIHNPKLFLIIYIVGALPLSLLVASLSLLSTSRYLKSHIVRLEFLYQIVDIWIEAGNVRETSELDLKRLHRFKVGHAVPILIFSLFTTVSIVTAVTAAVSSPSGKKRSSKPTLRTVFTALRVGWYRTLITSVVSVLFWVVSGHALPALIAAVGYPTSIAVLFISVAIDVYAMAVLGVALVVSVAEDRYGIDAIRVGSGLMKGRRISGWVLSGLILLSMNCIGKEIVGVLDGKDWGEVNEGKNWMVEMRVGYVIGLMVLLGWLVMWCYVVITVFYCDCRKRHAVIRQDEQELLDGNFGI
ncbi:uncharacterized protein LOC141597208 [Silene latifolia]|uniref:uncharacterized protein LOC141597208 n=1 Tax=Silene latifolia TaxID=37657 RepID=UPI003D7734D4